MDRKPKSPAAVRLTKRKAEPASSPLSVPSQDRREYPDFPRVGVGGIVVHDGHVLLVRRGSEPLKGKWSIPGGLVEVGEKLQEALEREIKEETGIKVEATHMMGLFERIQRDPEDGRVRYHYVIVDYLCELRGSRARGPKPPKPQPASDITDAEWVEGEMLSLYDLSAEAEKVIAKALETVDPDW
jgi:8-oxo-dGTP diphosphatase